MKITVLKPPTIDPTATTPPPGRALRVDGDEAGLMIDNEARKPWSSVRFLTLVQRTAESPLALLMLVDGRRRPFDVSTADFSGSAFAECGNDPRRAAVAMLRHAPRAVLDQATVEALRGTLPRPLESDLRAYLAAVQRALQVSDSTGPGTETGTETRAAPVAAQADTAAPATVVPESRCPHCEHPRPRDARKCDRCGIVFAKLERQIQGDRASDGPDALLGDAAGDMAGDDDPFGFGLPESTTQPTSRWGEEFLSADSVAASVIGVLRSDATRLVATAAACLTFWLVVAGTAAWIADGAWRWITIVLGTIVAYCHVMLSQSHALHARVSDTAWTPGSAWVFGLGRLIRVLPARLVGVAAVVLGLAAFVVPGFVFALRTAFVESMVAIERKTPQGLTWGQVSTNLSDGVRFSVGGHLLVAAFVSLGFIVVPAFGTAIAAWLELVQPATWTLPSVGLFTIVVIALMATAYALTIWSTAVYVLCRALQDYQGPGVWNAPSGLSGWIRVTLIIDLFMLLFVLIRASKLDS